MVVGAAAVGSRLLNQGAVTHPTLGQANTALGPSAVVTFSVPAAGGRIDTSSFRARSLGVASLTPRQLLAELPGWALRTSTHGVTLRPKPRSKPLYLGLLQGQVAVFFGPPRYGWVDQLTGVRMQNLVAPDRARLSRGVPVQSVAAAWQMLEGIGG